VHEKPPDAHVWAFTNACISQTAADTLFHLLPGSRAEQGWREMERERTRERGKERESERTC